VAAAIFASVSAGVVLFQSALVFGAPWAHLRWVVRWRAPGLLWRFWRWALSQTWSLRAQLNGWLGAGHRRPSDNEHDRRVRPAL